MGIVGVEEGGGGGKGLWETKNVTSDPLAPSSSSTVSCRFLNR